MGFEILKAGVNKNPFVGLFLKTNSTTTFVPKTSPKKFCALCETVFGTRVAGLFVDESPFLGIFTALNDVGMVFPAFASDDELALARKTGLNACRLEGPLTPGNVLLANNKACLASPALTTKDASTVSDCLGVEVVQQAIAGVETVGASSVATDKGILAYNEATETELKFLKKTFKVGNAVNSSTNLGMPFNGLSVVANAKGALIGELTTGFEVQHVFQAFSSD